MRRLSLVSLILCLVAAIALVACSRARSDADLTADVQTRIQNQAGLAGAAITVQSNSGVVVLSGNVASEAERNSAENIAKQVDGVKGVVNNLQVVSAAVAPPAEQPVPTAQPSSDQRPAKPKSAPVRRAKPTESAATAVVPNATPALQPATPSVLEVTPVTIPEGTAVSIRLIDPVDTKKNKEGDTFRASLDSPIVIQDKTVIPKGADVEARLLSAKSAGRFSGSSSVVLVLSKITVGSKTYDVQTGEFTKQGTSRGKRSAAVIGGGAAVGAVIGGLTGGGKGAAIGAAAGAGAGTGVQALTKGQQIQLPSETVLEFQLKAPLTVTPSDPAKREKVG